MNINSRYTGPRASSQINSWAATRAKLQRLSARVSQPGRRVSAMQLAAQLLEDVLVRVPENED